jgi:AcrR family transcriptional regulator
VATSRTQAERRAVTRAKITSAGLEALAERGYAAMTLSGVAERAGVSVGAVTHHLPQKPDVAIAALQDGMVATLRTLHSRVEALPDADERDPLVLDEIYRCFGGTMYQAFLAVQVHARTDMVLSARLNRISDDGVTGIGQIAAAAWTPALLEHDGWHAFIWLVIDTVRGVALSTPAGPVDTSAPAWQLGRRLLGAELDRMRAVASER